MAPEGEPHATAPGGLLTLLEQLLELPSVDLCQLLNGATDTIAAWLSAEKVDVFLLDASRQSLAAVGTSDTPLGRKQRALGLDVLPLANGGHTVDVFRTGVAYVATDSSTDDGELLGIVRDLGVRSQVAVPLDIGGARRGVLLVVSPQPARFDEATQRSCEVLSRWLGALAHRTELAEQLRSAERERARRVTADEIVTVLAHDVRNHLAPLSGRLQAMQLKLHRGLVIEAVDLEAALSSVDRLRRLTADLLDLSRLDSGLFELRLQHLDVAKLVRDVAATLGTQREMVVAAPESLMLVADGDRLRQALENVVGNAIKHSTPADSVKLVVQGQGANVIVDVIDTGPGIRPELLPRLFNRYVTSDGKKGLGLGLYLAKSIADAHGGTLTATSSIGSGSRFRLTLPARHEPA